MYKSKNYFTSEFKTEAKTKVKRTSRSFRIWLEGDRLIQAGFKPNTRYSIEYGKRSKTIILELDETGKRKVSNSMRKGIARPIIDLESQKIGEFYQEGIELEIKYTKNRIVIQKQEEDLERGNWRFEFGKKFFNININL